MINSVLYCLLGHTGGIFEENENGFYVSQNIESITDSERESLKRVCELGFKYKILNEVSNSYEKIFNNDLIKSNPLNKEDKGESDNNQNKEKKDNTSIYLNGIYRSIKQFLATYRNIIEQLESKYYKEMNLTLYDILTPLSSYYTKMESLQELLNYIYQNNLTGGEFLNYLYKNSLNGNPFVKDLYKNLFQNCNIILNNMITTWIINNIIQNNEFFIASNNTLSNEPDINGNIFSSSNNELQSWNTNYYIVNNNIPIYYPKELVEDILFIGKAIKVLNSNKNSDECKISFNDMSIFYTSLQGLNEIIFKKNDNILNMIDIEFYCKIITLIKNCVSKYLWKLVVNKNEFIKHMNAVRNIFLTYHGEFYYNFITKIIDLLNMPNFNKNIENDINELYFKSSLKEVFHIDTDRENFNIYNPFRVKLISSGFNFNFQKKEYFKEYLMNKELLLMGGLNYDSSVNSLKLLNTSYKSSNGVLWNTSSYDLDDEFHIIFDFKLKNFTKKDEMDDIQDFSSSQIIKKKLNSNNDINNNKYYIQFNYIMHTSKNFPNQPPINLAEMICYFNFQFNLFYDNKEDPSELTSVKFILYYFNKNKNINKKIFEIEIDNKTKIYDGKYKSNILELFKHYDDISHMIIDFKDNVLTIRNKEDSFNISLPFIMNNYLTKDKRKILIGLVVQSKNVDMLLEYINWNCNFYSGEIFNENSNLILINYTPPWPHNFIFNTNTIKSYNDIFNLVFPLKTSLTMLNSLWIQKKNICNHYNNLFKVIDSIHAEFHTFLQNLISFYMFDVVEVNFKKFFDNISKYEDLEELLNHHEEFLREVITDTFVKSKKIMRTLFNILFVIRKFYNYVREILQKVHEVMYMQETNYHIKKKNYTIPDEIIYKNELFQIKEEFEEKVTIFKNTFEKIKNTKHFKIISQLLTRFESNNKND
jgi:hypothetical protein